MPKMVSICAHRYAQQDLEKFETFECEEKDVETLIKLKRAELEEEETVVEAPPKRKRGRPRKVH